MKWQDMLDKRYGRLTVIGDAGRTKSYAHKLVCKCDCGKISVVYASNLERGHTTSCGCVKREIIATGANTVHGKRYTRLYEIYNSVKTQLRADHPRMKEESIERKARTAAAKYAERQQRYRAETIARTEIAQAYNAGADAFIREAIRHDLMPEMKKEWSTALDERVCKECQALEGVQISMDDSFETQSGRRNVTVLLPPLHPRCKCAVKYVEATYEIV